MCVNFTKNGGVDGKLRGVSRLEWPEEWNREKGIGRGFGTFRRKENIRNGMRYRPAHFGPRTMLGSRILGSVLEIVRHSPDHRRQNVQGIVSSDRLTSLYNVDGGLFAHPTMVSAHFEALDSELLKNTKSLKLIIFDAFSRGQRIE
jgi:hypothetical protein